MKRPLMIPLVEESCGFLEIQFFIYTKHCPAEILTVAKLRQNEAMLLRVVDTGQIATAVIARN